MLLHLASQSHKGRGERASPGYALLALPTRTQRHDGRLPVQGLTGGVHTRVWCVSVVSVSVSVCAVCVWYEYRVL